LLLVSALASLGLGILTASEGRGATVAPAGVRLVTVAHFKFPTNIASTPADPNAIYVLERTGRVWIVRNGRKLSRPFLDLHKKIRLGLNTERGLLGLAFAPNYAKSGLFYVYYTNQQGNVRLKQFRRSPRDRNRAAAGNGRTILAIRHPAIAHYAGQLQFGRDGDLYIAVGDGDPGGDPANRAQTLNNLLGKILRIRPTASGRRKYTIPRGNPFAHRHGARPEIYAYGLRNPFKFSFGPSGGTFIGDVGESRFEEIDYRAKGKLAGSNFGWSRYEGDSIFNASRSAFHPIFPVIVEPHQGGPSGTHENWCAIIGGYVVQDRGVPSLRNHYLFADHCSGRIYQTRIGSDGKAFGTAYTGITVPALVTSFGVDAHHHVYVAAENGRVYRVVG
jgi:glucose/arabinose dehydrogenase